MVALLWIAPGARAMPVISSPPPLSITIDNGHDSSAAGDRRRYTVTVTNHGAATLQGLLITQTVPAGLTYATADGRGAYAQQTVTWELDLGARERSTRHSVMTVASTSPALLRLATVVCLRTASTGEPVSCAADSDQLPAGAAAEVAAARVDPTTWGQLLGRAWPWFGGTGLAAVAVGAVLLVHRRRVSMSSIG